MELKRLDGLPLLYFLLIIIYIYSIDYSKSGDIFWVKTNV